MKINVNQIPIEGLVVKENIDAKELDLEIPEIKFDEPVRVEARITKITNAVSANLKLTGSFYTECSRCLDKFKINLDKMLKLNLQVSMSDEVIDFNTDIREEIILDYPMKPLCKPGCKGICPNCGKNLNEETCECNV